MIDTASWYPLARQWPPWGGAHSAYMNLGYAIEEWMDQKNFDTFCFVVDSNAYGEGVLGGWLELSGDTGMSYRPVNCAPGGDGTNDEVG